MFSSGLDLVPGPLKLCFCSPFVAPRVLETLFVTGRLPNDDFITGGAFASLRRRVVTVTFD